MTVKTSPSDNGDGHQYTEDDTYRALRRLPYKELKVLVRAQGQIFVNLTSAQKKEFLEKYGWTFDELLKALLDELNEQLRKFI
jgi:hypothetical protein